MTEQQFPDLERLMAGNPASPVMRRLALFEYGFRPFFLMAGLYAALALVLWLAVSFGTIELGGPWAGAAWHGHEMIYGFALAAVAGFMLTAVPGWTNTPALRGLPLATLAAVWLAGRAALWASGALEPAVVALADLAFVPLLALAVGRPLVARARETRNPRNLGFLVFLALLWAGDLLSHLAVLGVSTGLDELGLRLGRDTLLVMVALVGGRIVPTFTRSALRGGGGEDVEVRSPLAVDAAAIASLALMLLADLALGEGAVSGCLALAAAVAHAVRLSFWRPLASAKRPILWVLHLGYGWLVLGLALKAAADLTPWVPASTALHALTAGALGTMILAVMSRAALGHTGRPLVAGRPTVAAYLLVSAAALLRAAAPFFPELYGPLLLAGGIAWSLAFALFSAVYLPILLKPRIDGRPG